LAQAVVGRPSGPVVPGAGGECGRPWAMRVPTPRSRVHLVRVRRGGHRSASIGGDDPALRLWTVLRSAG